MQNNATSTQLLKYMFLPKKKLNLNSIIIYKVHFSGVALRNGNNNVLTHAEKRTVAYKKKKKKEKTLKKVSSLQKRTSGLSAQNVLRSTHRRWEFPNNNNKKSTKKKVDAETEVLLCLQRAAQGGCLRDFYKAFRGGAAPPTFPASLYWATAAVRIDG